MSQASDINHTVVLRDGKLSLPGIAIFGRPFPKSCPTFRVQDGHRARSYGASSGPDLRYSVTQVPDMQCSGRSTSPTNLLHSIMMPKM